MRHSSPGKPNPGRKQNPHKFSHRSSSAADFRRASASSNIRSASWRTAEMGHEFRPSASACSSRPGNSVAAREPAPNVAFTRASAFVMASSLTTAAGFAPAFAAAALRNSNCSRQRCSLIFDSAHTSNVPTSVSRAPSFTGISRSPCLPNRITAFNGACKCKSATDATFTRVPISSSSRVSELYMRNDTGLFATRCRLSSSSSMVRPSSDPRGTRHTTSCSPTPM